MKSSSLPSTVLAAAACPWVLGPYAAALGMWNLVTGGMSLSHAAEEVFPFTLLCVAIAYAAVLIIGVPAHLLLVRLDKVNLWHYLALSAGTVIMLLIAAVLVFDGIAELSIPSGEDLTRVLLLLVAPAVLVSGTGWYIAFGRGDSTSI